MNKTQSKKEPFPSFEEEEKLFVVVKKSNCGAPAGKYDEQLKTKDRLLEENVTIKEETKALMAQLEKEQGNLSVYHDKVSEKDKNHLIGCKLIFN